MSYVPTRRLFIVSAALTLLVLALLVGCALNPIPDPTPIPPTPLPPTPTPLPRGGTLTVRLAQDVPELRPWQPRSRGEELITALVYSGLTRLDERLRPQPDLATSWEATPDGRLITFTLRTDVTWHDGQPLTAEDVAYTLGALREISPTTALLLDLRRITEVTAPNSSTVLISLTERYAPIFSLLAVPVLPKHVLIDKDIAALNFWDVPVGSGPFQLEERRPDAAITLLANRRFYRGAPLLDRVAFVVAPDAQVAADALRGGQLLLAELPWEQVSPVVQAVPGMQSGAYAENGYYFLAFNMRAGRPFADLRLRQALAKAVDLPALVAEVTAGGGAPIGSSAAPGSWADQVPPPNSTVDLEGARRLLDEAGWKVPPGESIRQREGITLTAQLFVRGDDPRRVRAAEVIAAAGRQIGMQIVVQPADFETVIRSKYAPPYDFDLLLGSWSNGAGDPNFADYAFYDPDDFALFHSSQINQGVADTRPVLNIVGFSDSAYDNQAGAARQLYDPDDRLHALQLAQARVAELKPYLFLWADRIPVLLAPQVTTLDGPVHLDTPMYLHNIERWHLKR
ncbi:MAG TPA: peptide ABC transporter substrate-binding protein [Roseiflexaceae bacterium]|nr:peptide ABC transporter substrate-binding protein [Roseiflexaceae bacterium]